MGKVGDYSSAEAQSVYFTAQANRAIFHPDAVGQTGFFSFGKATKIREKSFEFKPA